MKEKLKKINEFEWLLPKGSRERMNVGAKIIANKAVLDAIEDDAVEQLTNVACLPGVIEPVIGLPDMHWGYGLPMGAVSAFDYKDGIISSGLCGFDINCLSGNTKILHKFGYKKNIKDFEKDWSKETIKCLNPTSEVKNTGLNRFIKVKPENRVFEVETLSGRKIVATEDHPFFTKKGMIPLKSLNGEFISIFPFEGVDYEEPKDKIILDESSIEKRFREELEKKGLLPLKFSNKKLPLILKIIGFALGDGTLSKDYIRFYEDTENLEQIREDIREIGYEPGKISSRRRKHKIKTLYGIVKFEREEHSFSVSSRAFLSLIRALGFPIGNRTKIKYEIPKWIFECPKWHKRLFLAALFGAELTSPKTVTKHGYNFYEQIFSMNKSESLIESGKKFLKQISKLLKEFGIESKIIKHRKEYVNKKGDVSFRVRLQISSKPENLIKLWSIIGFEYNKKKTFLANAAIHYLKYKEVVLKERKEAEKQARKLTKQKISPKEIYEKLCSEFVNKRFLERTLYEGRKNNPRIAFNFLKFDEFLKKYTSDLGKTGQVWDKIISKKQVKFNDFVFDFTVDDPNHNFIANNFVVSNCGVNSIRTNLTAKEVSQKIRELIKTLFETIPCGVGSKGKLKLTREQLNEVLVNGVNWALENGYGTKHDMEHLEERGCMEGADPSKVSDLAKKRGAPQLGTLGAGNHFLEVQKVSDIFDPETAKKWGILDKDQVLIMLHCGSRGLGHQVATDYLQIQEKAVEKYKIWLPDRQLACAPASSKEGLDFFDAMKCAVNYSFTNRFVMTHWIREAFEKVFKKSWEDMEMKTVYGLCHNVVKLEEHTVNGEKRKLFVHRKGATRSFPGDVVLIAGTMGTASYICKGTELSMEKSFGSSVHGAGRSMSRNQAIRSYRGSEIQEKLAQRGIISRATHPSVLAEEAPLAYKDIESVIDSVQGAGISTKVARLVPLGVCKG